MRFGHFITRKLLVRHGCQLSFTPVFARVRLQNTEVVRLLRMEGLSGERRCLQSRP
jgi:hypothetical protein